nr:hypothetical protein [Saliphagus infecundisoli]
MFGPLGKGTVLLVQLDLLDDVLVPRANAVLGPPFEGRETVLGFLGEADVPDQAVALANVERDVGECDFLDVEIIEVLLAEFGDDRQPEPELSNFDRWFHDIHTVDVVLDGRLLEPMTTRVTVSASVQRLPNVDDFLDDGGQEVAASHPYVNHVEVVQFREQRRNQVA